MPVTVKESSGSVLPSMASYVGCGAVDAWVTDQALVLKNGHLVASVNYIYYSEHSKDVFGFICRECLADDHPESTAGLLARFKAGERFIPDVEVSK